MANTREQVHTEMVAFRLSPVLLAKVDKIAKARKVKRSLVLRALIEKGLTHPDGVGGSRRSTKKETP